MEKLPMCRICLMQNVRMFVVVNRNLRELYKKLTDIPFVTKDSRPILACFFCCAKLKQCYRLLRQCLEAEELFAQMMDKDYAPNPLINQDHLGIFSGFIKSPTENISIIDGYQTETIAIKGELPAVNERQGNIIEPQEEHQSDELDPEKLDNSCLDVADLEDYVSLMEFKAEVEEDQKVSKEKRRIRETKRAAVAKKPKLLTRKTKQEDAKTADQTKIEKSDSKVIRATQKRTSKPGTYFKEPHKSHQRSFNRVNKITQIDEKPYKCDVCQRSFTVKATLSKHIRIHTGEKPFKCDVCQRSFTVKATLSKHILIHTGEKPFKCDVCQRSFNQNGTLSRHIRLHTGEKPSKCDVCQHSFRDKSTLSNHIRIHTGEKPYKCDVCQRSFSQNSILAQHIRIHTGVKPYKCDVCQRSFSQISSLTTHIRLHTGEKPYKCEICLR